VTTYTHDPVGNRTTRVRLGTTDTYSYDQADSIQSISTNDGHRTTTVTYVVNNDGNMVARGHDYFLYDQANRMTKSAGRQPSKYAYNGDGLRVQSNVGNGPYTTHVWDVGAGLPLLLFDGNRKYVYEQPAWHTRWMATASWRSTTPTGSAACER